MNAIPVADSETGKEYDARVTNDHERNNTEQKRIMDDPPLERLGAGKYGILGRLMILHSRLSGGADGTLGIRVRLTPHG